MTTKNCLNCETELAGHYCSGCGQKADTHRITFRNFISHDLLHGTFHIEKGMLFTARQALLRPGKAALDYISGKRKPYYNVFYLVLITFGLLLFVRHFWDQIPGEEIIDKKPYLNEASRKLDEIFAQKSKIIVFLFVPLAALNGFILFRKKNLNLSEHFIISGMVLAGMLLISLLGNVFFYFDLLIPFSDTFALIMSWVVTVLVIFQMGYGYFNAFASDYSKWGIACRIVLFYLLCALQILILFAFVWGWVSNWKFGTVTVSPF
ncbi:DUF3667 domain-containing protein [Flavobacterium sp.]|uniref:DUF3667 domain-containing protein n=1 Tax=Flavobacterium sp. TaxID=239 RepID=UPI0039E6A099